MKKEDAIVLEALINHVRPLVSNIKFSDVYKNEWAAPRAVDITDITAKDGSILGQINIKGNFLLIDIVHVLPNELNLDGVIDYNIADPDIIEMFTLRMKELDAYYQGRYCGRID